MDETQLQAYANLFYYRQGVWIGIFVLLSFWIGNSSMGGPLLLVVMLSLCVAAVGAISAPFSAAFGKNRCKDCGHKWR